MAGRPSRSFEFGDVRSAPTGGHGNWPQGLPSEAVLRCALLKQYRQLSYEELAFHLEDSASFRAFARLPWGWSPKKSVLHKTISAIRADTWEAITKCCWPAPARKVGKRQGRACGQHRHGGADPRPSDSSLLWDCVRVMVRLLQPGGFAGQHHSLARSLPRGEEAGSGDRVYPRSPERVQH